MSTTTAATVAAAVTSTAATTAAKRLRTRLVDDEGPAAEIGAVEAIDCGLRLFVRLHFDEGEPSRTAGRHVAHHAHRFNRTCLTEQILELAFSGA